MTVQLLLVQALNGLQFGVLLFLVAAGLMLAPVFHRVLHRFHWEDQ